MRLVKGAKYRDAWDLEPDNLGLNPGSATYQLCVTLGKLPVELVRIKLDHACKALRTLSGIEQLTSKCFYYSSYGLPIINNATSPTQLPEPGLIQNMRLWSRRL